MISCVARVTLFSHLTLYAVTGSAALPDERGTDEPIGEASMSLLELIARADERGLAASGVACLDRCLPPPEAGEDPEPLRPLWACCESGADWAARLGAVHTALEAAAARDATAARIRTQLDAAPRDFAAGPLRAWADACSLLALDIHRESDVPVGDGAPAVGDPAGRCGRGRRSARHGRTPPPGRDPGGPRRDRGRGGRPDRSATRPGPVDGGTAGAARGDVPPCPRPWQNGRRDPDMTSGGGGDDDRGRHPPQERPRPSSTGPQSDPVLISASTVRFLSHRTVSGDSCGLYKSWTGHRPTT